MRRAAEWQGNTEVRNAAANHPNANRGAHLGVGGSLPQVGREWRAACRTRRRSVGQSPPLARAPRAVWEQRLALADVPRAATTGERQIGGWGSGLRAPRQVRSGGGNPSDRRRKRPGREAGLRYSAGRAPRGCGRFLPSMVEMRSGQQADRARPMNSIEGQCRPAGRLVPRHQHPTISPRLALPATPASPRWNEQNNQQQ